MLPLFVVLLLVVRGLPSMLAAPPDSNRRDRIATAFFGATGLPIIVAVTAIGVERGRTRHRNRCGARRRGNAVGAAVPAHRTRRPAHRRSIASTNDDRRRGHPHRGLSTRRRSAADQHAVAMLSDARSTVAPRSSVDRAGGFYPLGREFESLRGDLPCPSARPFVSALPARLAAWLPRVTDWSGSTAR